MENLNAIVRGNHQENEEKPPPRVCPRCGSDNTRFSFYNNYKVSQPRYNCKNCHRFWTHGGVIRNINGRKNKRARKDQPSVSQVDSFIQQVDHHQPFSHAQETNEFLGSFGGSSSSGVVGNYFSSFPETNDDMLAPTRSIPTMDRFDLFDGSFNQGCYYGAGFYDLVGNPLMNQSSGGHVDNYNSYFVNQEDPNKLNQSFNNNMNMNHNATTSGSRGYLGTDHMINNNKNNNKDRNKSVFRSSHH